MKKKRKIELSNYGDFLSGRSLARELVNTLSKEESLTSIEVSFEGVSSATQSFISELIVELHNKGIKPKEIKFECISDDVVKNRVENEVERISKLIA